MDFIKSQYFLQTKEFLIELYDRLSARTLFITEPVIKMFKTLVFFFSELRVESWILQFPLSDRSDKFSVLYIGKKHRLKFIEDLLGIKNARTDKNSSLFFWEINRCLINGNCESDLTIVDVNKILYKIIKPEWFSRVPDSVKSVLYLSGALQDAKNMFRKNVLRKEQRIRLQNYRYRVLHSESALRHFYYEMYVPYIKRRFREFAVIDNYYKVRRLFRTGFLLIVEKENRFISGVICRIRNNIFSFDLVGIENGDLELLNEGGLDALYYFSILLALEKRCTMIDFGISRPFLNDGLVRYKRRWGTALVPNKKECRIIGVRFNDPNNMKKLSILNNYPVLFDEGDLSGYVFLNEESPVGLKYIGHIEKAYFNPGLKYLIVFSSSGFDKEAVEHYTAHPDDRVRLADMGANNLRLKSLSGFPPCNVLKG